MVLSGGDRFTPGFVMYRTLPALALLLGIALMPVPAADPPPTAEDARLATLFQSYLDEEFRRHPVFATQQGNHEYDDQLDDLSPEARHKDRETARQRLADLRQEIDYQKLSRNGQIDFDIWTHSLEYSLWSAANDDRFAFDPRVYG